MKKILAGVAVVALSTLAGSGLAQASGYNTPDPETTVDNGTPEPGGSFTVTVTGCVAGSVVTFEFEGQTVDTEADENGDASAELIAPSEDGDYSGTATCGDVVSSFSIAVVTPSVETTSTIPTPAPNTLPPTGGGSSSDSTIAIALAMLLAGLGIVGATARRRSETTSI